MGKYKWIDDFDDLNYIERESGELKKIESIKDLKKINPSKTFKLLETWCPYCNNAETSVKNLKNFSKLRNETFVNIVFDAIKDYHLTYFNLKDIKKTLKIENLSDGTLQRKALTILSVLGYIKKEIIEYKNKKGETKFKIIYNLNQEVCPPKCYCSFKDKHNLDFRKEGINTNYFWGKK